MEWTLSALVFMLLIQMSGAMTANSDIVGMAVAGCVGFVLFSIVIAIIAVSFSWTDWFNHWMRQRGQVRMPKSYFKKKEEIKKRLISGSVGSRTPSMVNGHLPAQSIDRAVSPSLTNYQTNNRDHAIILQPGMKMNTHPTSKTSWVQGWNQKEGPFSNKIYEEKDVTMELGEEADEEYIIETELVDNEHLDIGPFKNDHSKEVPINGEIYSEPYLYSTVNEATKLRNSKKSNGRPPSGNTQLLVTANMEMVEHNGDAQHEEDVTIGNFDDVLVHL